MANKGAIILNLKINWECFDLVNCHLASGTSKKDYHKRLDNLKEIQDFLKKSDSSLKIIMGDFNWRNQVDLNTLYSLIAQYKLTNDPNLKYQCIEKLMENQEYSLKSRPKDDYDENVIEFLPSYKWVQNTRDFDIKDGKRIPSWTDRVLYNS